ncbi:hypothetical protein Tco_1561134 [Tanacetum coccineum]
MEECHLLLMDQVDLVNPEGNRVVPGVRKPLPIGGPPGQLKAAYCPDFGLKELVPSLWIESERDYDISTAYDISHLWFKRKEFYITRHSAPSDRHAVRSHIRILSVVSLKTFSRNSYAYLKEIVLRRADYKEYKISEADFKIYIRMILKTCTCFVFKASSTTYLKQTKLPYSLQSTCRLGTWSSDNVWKTCNSVLRVIKRSSTLHNRAGMQLIFYSKKITPLSTSQGP